MTEARHRLSAMAVNVGLGTNIVLAALKTAIGVLGHSAALLADGINSMSDVTYYIVVKVFMGRARQPPDSEHPFGHSQLESIAALVVGSFVIATAVAIFWDAVNGAYDVITATSRTPGATALTLWVALLTIAIKIGLLFYTRSIGRATRNLAVSALASDHRNDVFSATGAAAGILMSRLGGYAWADPVAGAIVALVILRTGIGILRDSSRDLMDTLPDGILDEQIRGLVTGISGVRSVEEIRAHRFGPYLVVNVQIGIDGSLSVSAGDHIATQIEATLEREIDFMRRVYVHYHPARLDAALTPDGGSRSG